MRFGRWTVMERAELPVKLKNGIVNGWLCRCDCGTERVIDRESLVSYGIVEMKKDNFGPGECRAAVVLDREGDTSRNMRASLDRGEVRRCSQKRMMRLR